MREAHAAAVLKSDRPEAEKLAAIDVLRMRGGQDTLAILSALSGSSEGAIRDASDKAIATIQGELKVWEVAQDVWYGISLGSVVAVGMVHAGLDH